MNVTTPIQPVTIETIAFAIDLPDAHVERLRQDHPTVRFVHVGDDIDHATLSTMDAFVGFSLPPERIRAAPRLRWIQLMSAGVDHILCPELDERGIVLTNASGVHAPNIGEHVLSMMLAFARQLPRLILDQQDRVWRDNWIRDRVFELTDQTLLIVGTGEIGRAVAHRAKPFGMRVIGVRRRHDGTPLEDFDAVYGHSSLSDAVHEADHVAICLPATTSTRHLFNAEVLGAMKPSAFLYNIGRGSIVDQDALIEALKAGRIAGAGLDVTSPEPLDPDSPLWAQDNVLITAHTSGGTPRYWDRAIPILSQNLTRIQAGEPLLNLVDTTSGY